MDEPRTARDFAELSGRLAEHARVLLDREVMTSAPTVDGPARVEAICAVSRAASATAEALAYTEPEPDKSPGGEDPGPRDAWAPRRGSILQEMGAVCSAPWVEVRPSRTGGFIMVSVPENRDPEDMADEIRRALRRSA
jgi:hypothetical protein